MIVTHSSHHMWSKQCNIEPLLHYGKSDQKRIKQTIESAENLGISYKIEPAAQSFFEWFQPFYEHSIAEKDNPNPADVFSLTVGKPGTELQYYTLTVFENGKEVGGCIFSDRGDRFSIAYRMYQNSWSIKTRGAGPALYGEYILDELSYREKKERLVHGQDRNPYGLNSAIGLAIFKLSAGCYATLPKKYEMNELDTSTITTDVLVLLPPRDGIKITDAILFTTPETEQKYEQLFNYEQQLKIRKEYR